MKTLVLNSGSTSVKWAVFEDGLRLRGGNVQVANGHRLAIYDVLEVAGLVDAVGHRVVHGGDLFTAPMMVDEAVADDLSTLSDLAPLHQPHNVAGIDAVFEMWPDVPQVACFDTAFHNREPDFARKAYALPREMYDKGIRRYGFHGLAYESFAQAHPEGDYVVAHLGGGCSACAIRDGESLDTSLGYSTLAGLPMGTRSGDVDPGLVLELVNQYGVERTEEILYRESGLLGLCGMSNMQEVEQACMDGNERARGALDVFCFRVAREIRALTVNFMGRRCKFAFMGGIGENARLVRSEVCAWLGFEPAIIHHADEEAVIDRHVRELLGA